MYLGADLSDSFTVIIPDRRGRGLSGPHRPNHSINTEREDLHALLRDTGAQHLFGLSSGAVICLWAVLDYPQIQSLAVYEPPLPIGGVDPARWLPFFERAMARGKLAEAMIAIMRGTTDSRIIGLVPSVILAPLMSLAIEAEAKKAKPGDVALKKLIPTMRFDAKVVSDTKGSLDRLKEIHAAVLLLGGSKSPAYLKTALDALEMLIPQVRRVEFPGLGHLAPDNRGKPELVARELRRYFSKTAAVLEQ